MSSGVWTPDVQVRPSTLFGASLLVLVIGGTGLMVAGQVITGEGHRRRVAAMARQVAQLELTDLCLFTEANYTRHPTQADLHAAFQDHPMALEHFPSGSLTMPPVLIQKND